MCYLQFHPYSCCQVATTHMPSFLAMCFRLINKFWEKLLDQFCLKFISTVLFGMAMGCLDFNHCAAMIVAMVALQNVLATCFRSVNRLQNRLQ